MNVGDLAFKNMLNEVMQNGVIDKDPRPYWLEEDGSHTPAHSLFTTQYMEQFDISKGEFPISTIKPTAWKTGIREMLWIYQEASNDLTVAREKFGIKWWDSWDIGDGTIGSTYGAIVKKYDLMNTLLEGIKNNPYGRRHIMSLWQEEELRGVIGLPPCAFQTLWSVRGEYLDCTLVQRKSKTLNNVEPTRKVCPHCGIELNITMFGIRKVYRKGIEYRCRASWCKICTAEVNKQRYRNKVLEKLRD